jgi:hypothetical protein
VLPFGFSFKMIRMNRFIWRQITGLGLPLAETDERALTLFIRQG